MGLKGTNKLIKPPRKPLPKKPLPRKPLPKKPLPRKPLPRKPPPRKPPQTGEVRLHSGAPYPM